MVRMDKCVEALFTLHGTSEAERSKMLQVLKVMKGALTISKSKTGECIYRYNKNEKHKLEVLLRIFRKEGKYIKAKCENEQKYVIRRWSKMIEKQSQVSPESVFEELMNIGGTNDKDVWDKGSEDEGKAFWAILEQALSADDEPVTFRAGATDVDVDAETTKDERKDLLDQVDEKPYITEVPEIRRKYQNDNNENKLQPIDKTPELGKNTEQRRKSPKRTQIKMQPTLPTITEANHLDNTQGKPEIGRTKTSRASSWAMPNKDRYLDYIDKQKIRHQDLIIRNAITRIQTLYTDGSGFMKQQLKSNLASDNVKHGTKVPNQQTPEDAFPSPRQDLRLHRQNSQPLIKLESKSQETQEDACVNPRQSFYRQKTQPLIHLKEPRRKKSSTTINVPSYPPHSKSAPIVLPDIASTTHN